MLGEQFKMIHDEEIDEETWIKQTTSLLTEICEQIQSITNKIRVKNNSNKLSYQIPILQTII